MSVVPCGRSVALDEPVRIDGSRDFVEWWLVERLLQDEGKRKKKRKKKEEEETVIAVCIIIGALVIEGRDVNIFIFSSRCHCDLRTLVPSNGNKEEIKLTESKLEKLRSNTELKNKKILYTILITSSNKLN